MTCNSDRGLSRVQGYRLGLEWDIRTSRSFNLMHLSFSLLIQSTQVCRGALPEELLGLNESESRGERRLHP